LQLPRTGRRLTAALLVVVLATVAVGVYLVAHRALSQSVPAGTRPPSARIVFGRINANGDEYAFTIRADGTGEKQLVAASTCCMVWSHKRDRLTLGASACSTCSIPTAIVNADGSGYRVLPLDSSGMNLIASAWSPDDSRLAFGGWNDSKPSLNGLYTADATDGGNRRRLTTTTDALQDIPISFSPDGSKILFWRGPGNVSGQPAGQLFVVGVSGGAVIQVSPPGMKVWACCYFGAPGGWSPSGTQISFAAFSPSASDPGRSAVFVAAGDGTNARQISDWGEYTTSARWSPTGQWIVFDIKFNLALGTHNLYLVRPDGSGSHLISTVSAVCCAVWSPDGNRLVFPRGPDQATDLWTVKTDGSQLTQLTHTPANLTDIGWGAGT
jgi:Tol biopolymer transport system component